MEKKLATKQSTSVANSNLIKEAQSLTGESGGNFIPFIPIIRVNNRKEYKTATIDGKEKEIKVLPDASFTITKRYDNTGEYETIKFSDSLEAVIIRIRYKINEKYDKDNPKKKLYYSYDFDMHDQNIKVNGGNKIIIEGNYQELKEHFKTGISDKGFPTKSFDLMMILYIHLDDEVYRFERKVIGDDPWYKYSNSFAKDDTYVAYKTKFLLKKAVAGDNEYWQLSFEKGKGVDINKEVDMQREVNKFFRVATDVRESPKDELPIIQVEDDTIDPAAPEEGEVGPPNNNVAAMPF